MEEIYNDLISSLTSFLSLSTIGTWGPYSSLCAGACPTHCKMFSNIHGLYQLDASSTISSNGANEKCFHVLPSVAGWQDCPS